MMLATPKISIITVVYNAAKALEATINSIAKQTYNNIEYIVVDGASKDETVNVIKTNANSITKWISEPDKGLYYAMNKGLLMATGEYVWFINAGDLIAEDNTVERIINNSDSLADIYYGETNIIDEQGNLIGQRRLKAPKKLTANSFKKGMLVCHQSILVKRSIATTYNTEYRIAADIDWVINALKKANHIENTNMVLSVFVSGGLASKNLIESNKERFKIMVKHYGFFQSVFYNILMLFRLMYTYLKLGRL